jgi:hypothetical protein
VVISATLQRTFNMNIRIALASLAFVCAAPLAHAQIVIQTPQFPGVQRVEPDRRDQRAAQEREEYWRRQHNQRERDSEWRRREDFRSEEHRREEWQRDHCVRNWQGQEYCRR